MCVGQGAPRFRLVVPALSREFGAGNETRTRDIFLGKEVLYQLSYTRLVLERPQTSYVALSNIITGTFPVAGYLQWSGTRELNSDYTAPDRIGCHTPPSLVNLSGFSTLPHQKVSNTRGLYLVTNTAVRQTRN